MMDRTITPATVVGTCPAPALTLVQGLQLRSFARTRSEIVPEFGSGNTFVTVVVVCSCRSPAPRTTHGR
jgi:hypothetical protein